MSGPEVYCRFQEGEKVLCFHGPLIYEAKINKIETRDKQVKYFIHYHGWNKNWDEWVPEARMLKYSETNLERRRDLVKAHEAAKKAKKLAAAKRKLETGSPIPPQLKDAAGTAPNSEAKRLKEDEKETKTVDGAAAVEGGEISGSASTTSNEEKAASESGSTISATAKFSTRSSSRKSATPTSTTAKKNARKVQVSAKESEKNQQLPLSAQSKDENGSGKASGAAAIPDKPDTNTVETEEQFYTKVEIRINIPDELKPYLVDDWDYLTRQRKLVVLPARITVDQVIADYVKSKKANAATNAKTNRDAAIAEVTAGLKEYFNVMLGSQLLYKFEREQHADTLKESPDKAMSSVYGCIHLLRLFVKLGAMLTYTPLDEKSVQLLLFYINDFLAYMKRNASTLFMIQDYGTASPEYHRRAL